MVVGGTVGECFFRLMQLIRACQVQVATCASVPAKELVQVPPDTVSATFAITEENYTGEHFGCKEWRAAVRQMERAYGHGYKS